MKRIYYFLTLAVMVLAPLAMTSCDDPYYDDWRYDDPDEWYDRPYDNGSDDLVAMAQMLNGSWTRLATVQVSQVFTRDTSSKTFFIFFSILSPGARFRIIEIQNRASSF